MGFQQRLESILEPEGLILLELSHHRRARVWLDRLPDVEFQPDREIRGSILAVNRPHEKQIGRATVEVLIPRGPKLSYGLLGARLLPARPPLDDGQAEVVVHVSSRGLRYPSSLAAQVDDVRIGLLDEYAPSVIAGVQKAARLGGAPIGMELVIDGAAYSLVGSDRETFELLGNIVFRIVSSDVGGLSKAQISELFG